MTTSSNILSHRLPANPPPAQAPAHHRLPHVQITNDLLRGAQRYPKMTVWALAAVGAAGFALCENDHWSLGVPLLMGTFMLGGMIGYYSSPRMWIALSRYSTSAAELRQFIQPR